MSGEIEPGLRQRLEDSNIEAEDWLKWTPIIEALCQHNDGIRPVDLDAWSVGALYQVPTYPPHRIEEYVIGVLRGQALIFGREKGTFKKKLDFKSLELAQIGAPQFFPADEELGNNWGTCDLQAVSSAGEPVFRLGWSWGGSTSMAAASRERDRIAESLTTAPQMERSVDEYRQDIRESFEAYLAMGTGRFLPVAVSVVEAERLLGTARERGEEFVTFPGPSGASSIQLVDAIQKILSPDAVAHLEHPELGR